MLNRLRAFLPGAGAPGRRPAGPVARIALGLLAVIAIATLVGLIRLWPGDASPNLDQNDPTSRFGLGIQTVRGNVVESDEGPCGSPQAGRVFDGIAQPGADPHQTCQWSIVALTEGSDAGLRTLLETPLDARSRATGSPLLRPGDKIRLGRHSSGIYTFDDYERSSTLAWWALGAAAVIIAVGSWRGLRALIGIGVTLGAIIGFLVPTLLVGTDPVSAALVAGSAALFFTLYLVHGFSWKTSAALLGTLLSLGIAAVLSSAVVRTARITGMSNEYNVNLQILFGDISLSGLLLAGFIIGALGVLNDVTISQSATVVELAEVDPDAGVRRLFTGAMRVGRDHIASMVYTLVLAYAGSSLPLMLIFGISDRPLTSIITGDIVAVEIARSLVGAIAIAFSVPLTTIIAALLVREQAVQTAPAGTVPEPTPTSAAKQPRPVPPESAPPVRAPQPNRLPVANPPPAPPPTPAPPSSTHTAGMSVADLTRRLAAERPGPDGAPGSRHPGA